MAEDSGQERTEEATPKRRREAREKGQVARSRELGTMTVLMAGAIWMLVMGEAAMARLAALMTTTLSPPPAVLMDSSLLTRWFGNALWEGFWLVAPLLTMLVVAALVSPVALGGLAFSPAAIAPKLEKMSPIKGLARIFSWNGAIEFVKALAKFLLVSAVAVLVLRAAAPELLLLARQSLEPAVAHAAHLLAWAFLWLSAVLVLVAAIDVPFQLWDHTRKLRMTHQEVRDEHKESEGNPEVRARVRQVQREMAQRRMMEAVPDADVVITNPTHYAVALRYDAERAGAPRLVAKGAGEVAGRIRERAEAAGVPMFAAPPLARAIYFNTRLDQEIPRGLYLAVAQVLAYIYQLRAGAAPEPPAELPVPGELLDHPRETE